MFDPLTQAVLDAWADMGPRDRQMLATEQPALHDALLGLAMVARIRLDLD